MNFERVTGDSSIAYDKATKQYYAMCSDGKYRKIAPPISRWRMIVE